MKTIIFFFIVLVVGCSSRENIVSVRQAQNDSPVILRIRKDRTSIHSLLYPIAVQAEEQLLEQHKQKKKITKLYGKGGYLYISLPI